MHILEVSRIQPLAQLEDRWLVQVGVWVFENREDVLNLLLGEFLNAVLVWVVGVVVDVEQVVNDALVATCVHLGQLEAGGVVFDFLVLDGDALHLRFH